MSPGLCPCPSFSFAQHLQVISHLLPVDLLRRPSANHATARAGGLPETGLQNPTHQKAASGPLPGVCTGLRLLEASSTMDVGSWVVQGTHFRLVLLGGPSQTRPSVLPEARAMRLCSGGTEPADASLQVNLSPNPDMEVRSRM